MIARSKKMRIYGALLFAFFFLTGAISSPIFAAEDSKQTAPNYEDHVQPILRKYCLKCHGDDMQEAGINMQNYGAMLRGGSGGKIVESGRASESLLMQVLTSEESGARMPPDSPPLPKADIDVIRQWIDAGILENAASKSNAQPRSLAFMPSAEAIAKPSGPPAMPEGLPPIELPNLIRPLPVLAMASSPWAPVSAAAGQEHVRLLDSQTRKEIGQLPFPEGEPHTIRFSRNGDLLMVAGGRPVQSGKVVLFDVRTGKRLAEVGDELDTVIAADLSPDQTLVAIGGSGRVIKIYSTADGELKSKLIKHTDWITAAAFSPDGKVLATGDRTGAIHLWDVASAGIRLNLSEHKGAINALDWRTDGKLLVSAAEDGKLIWWDANDGFPAVVCDNAHPPERPAGTYGTIPRGILTARFAPSGQLVSTGRDRKIKIWSPEGTQMKDTVSESGLPISAALSFDSSTVAIGDTSGHVSFWVWNSTTNETK
ncbi:MAG: c-type cytochrome domain-containing protein [Planctomycetota bacterium]